MKLRERAGRPAGRPISARVFISAGVREAGGHRSRRPSSATIEELNRSRGSVRPAGRASEGKFRCQRATLRRRRLRRVSRAEMRREVARREPLGDASSRDSSRRRRRRRQDAELGASASANGCALDARAHMYCGAEYGTVHYIRVLYCSRIRTECAV